MNFVAEILTSILCYCQPMARKVVPAGAGDDADAHTRRYRSPLRERQLTQTREAILNALAAEILENGVHGLSVATVAARAAVAERTAYRHFPNLEAMLDSLSAMVGTRLTELLAGEARLRPDRRETPDDLIAALPTLYRAFDQIGAPARAVAVLTLTRGSDAGRQHRREILRETLAPETAHLSPDAARALIETMYMLAGSVAWFLLTRSGAITGDQAGLAAGRIMRAVLSDLRAERSEAGDTHR